MRTNCPAWKSSRGPSTRSEKSALVQCRFSTTRPSSHFSLIRVRLLNAVRLELQVLHLAAEHHDRAVPAVVAGVGKLERVGARNLQLPFFVAPKAQPRERHGVVEQLQVVALA